MSILIKGMEMPRMPDNIGQGEKIPYIDVRIFADGDAIVSKGTRPYYDKYFAVELPPHGRLVDAGELQKAIHERKYILRDYLGTSDFGMFIGGIDYAIQVAPTIIEAEE